MKLKLKTELLTTVALSVMLAGSSVSIAGQDKAFADRAHPMVDEATLNRAAAAFLEVDQFARQGDEQIAATNDAATKKQIADATEKAVTQAVKENGLEPAQYNQILQLVMSNPVLEQKFISHVAQAQGAYD